MSSDSLRRVVIIGAGIVGSSLAHHLTRLGVSDVTILEKGSMPRPGGSTGHASNFIFPVDHTKVLTGLITDSLRQYEELGVLTRSGGIEVARGEARMQELHRRMSSGGAWGVEPLSMITPAEILVLAQAVGDQGGEHLRVVDGKDEIGGVTGRAAGAGHQALLKDRDVVDPEPGEVMGET
jgi:glycine/D-amino acid oxidase-like deaminating enzyme